MVSHGTQFSFGVFFKPLITEFGWNRAVTSSAYSVYMAFYGISAIVMGTLSDRYGPRAIVIIGGLFVGLGIVLTSQVEALWQLYLFYGILLGMGMGAIYVPLSSSVAKWFTVRRGLALGIVGTGVAIGTLVIPPLSSHFIGLYGWRSSLIILGMASWIMIVPCGLLLRPAPSHEIVAPQGATPQFQRSSPSYSLLQATRRAPFWTLMAIFASVALGLFLVAVHIVAYATDMGLSAAEGASILGFFGVSRMFGMIGVGALSDRIGGKRALAICLIAQTAAILWLIPTHKLWAFYLFGLGFGFATGGWQPLFPAIIGNFFGMKSFGAIFGVIFLGGTIGAAIGPVLAGWIFDIARSYHPAFLAAASVSFGAALVIPFLRAPDSTKTSVP